MEANTIQLERVISLSGSAIELIKRGNRHPEQIEKLLSVLQDFKDMPSAKNSTSTEKANNPEYPGCFGNRCRACGGYIDDGGICNCGWDHDRRIKLK